MSGALWLGSFQLERRIATGGMGSVWAAHHRDGLPVAIKVLEGPLAQRFAPQLRHEIRSVAGLDHPGIIRLYDLGEVPVGAERFEPGSPWVAMQRAQGTLSDHPIYQWDDARTVLLLVLDALAHAHARGVIHRDLKPDNLLHMPGAACPWVLADFGLADAATGDRSAERTGGTPAYMAPEQVQGDWRSQGPTTDLYALGCLGWQLVYGDPPFVGSLQELLRAHVFEDPAAAVARFVVPDGTEDWLRTLLRKRPADRIPTAAHAARSLLMLGSAADEDTDLGLPQRRHRTPSTLLLGAWEGESRALGPALGAEETLPFPVDWRAEAPIPTLGPTAAGLRLFPLRTPNMVGRVPERDALWAALGDVLDTRRVRLVSLSGPPGIGTSRLASWVAERATELGLATAIHQPRGASLASTLRQRLRLQDLDVDATDRALAALGLPESLERELAARALCGLTEDRVQSRAVLAGLIAQLAALGPLILIEEDDEDPIASKLLDRRVPILVVQCGAPSPEASLNLSLAPLEPDQMNTLVHEALGLDSALTAHVVQRAGGNPQFAIRIVSDWVLRDELAHSGLGFQLRPDASHAMPTDLAAIWTAAATQLVGGLTPAQRTALELAATLGIEVHRKAWTLAATTAGVDADPAVREQLLVAGLAGARSDGSWVFHHPLLVESLQAMAGDRLADHHRACADAVDDLDRRAAHLLAAGPSEQALEALYTASKLHHRQGRLSRSALRMEQWAEVVVALGISDTDPRLVRGICERSSIRRMQGHDEEGEAAVRAALEWAQQPADRGALLAELGSILGQRGQVDEAVLINDEARALLLQAGDRVRWASLRTITALIQIDRGHHHEALAEIDEALAEDVQPQVRVQLLRLGATAYLRLHRLDEADRGLQEARRIARSIGHVRLLGAVANDMGMVCIKRDDFDGATTAFREAAAAYRLASAWAEVIARLNLAMLDHLRGEPRAAERELNHLLHQPRVRANPPLTSLIRLALVNAHAALGEWDAAGALTAAVEQNLDGLGPAWLSSQLDQCTEAAALADAQQRPELADRLKAIYARLEATRT